MRNAIGLLLALVFMMILFGVSLMAEEALGIDPKHNHGFFYSIYFIIRFVVIFYCSGKAAELIVKTPLLPRRKKK